MAQLRYILTDLANNNNKYWHVECVGSKVIMEYARVGDSPQHREHECGDDYHADRFMQSKIREKEKKGYTLQKTVGASGDHATPSQVATLVKNQIAAPDNETAKLLDFLAQRNIHAIEGMTSVRLDAGKLTTPLGPVTAEGLDEATKLLNQIEASIKDLSGGVVNDYLRIVPRKIGRKRIEPSEIFPNIEAVATELTVIEALRAALDDTTTTTEEKVAQIFRTNLTPIDPTSKEFKRIIKEFNSSVNRHHQSAGKKLKAAWRVSIGPADERFEQHLDNQRELWHGTKDANLLSILKGGYVIPKRGSSMQITGRMYGDGVYFSNQSTKSLNYASGYWSGGRGSSRCFMLLNEVAMGNIYYPKTGFSGTPPKGYDSAWARAGTAVMNDEQIVYRPSQAKPIILCEFV